jgi:hypothetical protein
MLKLISAMMNPVFQEDYKMESTVFVLFVAQELLFKNKFQLLWIWRNGQSPKSQP